jgi:hypothetical protein
MLDARHLTLDAGRSMPITRPSMIDAGRQSVARGLELGSIVMTEN